MPKTLRQWSGSYSPMSGTNRPTVPPDATPAQRFYSRWAAVYDLVARRTPGINRLRRHAVDKLGLNAGDTVVEMGCGTGANLGLLREAVGAGGTVIGIDLTAGTLALARRYVDRQGWTNVYLIRADATVPPLSPTRDIDGILASFVVGMLEGPETVVRSWCDSIDADGRVVLFNARRSDRRFAPLVNGPFRLLVHVSTPGPTRRALHSAVDRLDDRIDRAHSALAEELVEVERSEHVYGLVQIISGKRPPIQGS